MARDRSLDIAVTGLAGRFPGGDGSYDLGRWWTALTEGRVLTTRYDSAELAARGVPKTLLDDPDFVPVHGHLDGFDRFDNALFRVTPREAELMDPQHRLMLEAAWAALEDAGSAPLAAPAHRAETPTTAVFASAAGSGYMRAMVASGELDPMTLEDAVHGTEPDFMASLISYRLGLTGPAVAVQTACSSSLVAVHLAVQALLNGDCDQALVVAAGIPYPQAGHLAVEGGIHSPTGRCRPFDEHADGVVAGAGVAAVVLRRLDDATADGGDPYGVVLGTAVNNDGAAKAGYYAPSVDGQQAVIRAALRTADVPGDTVGYLETHGTGTRVGDPIEWSAASAALTAMGARPGQVAVGALKANVGHLDNAAGLASLIKALLVVRDGTVPPVASFTGLNPLLETAGSPLYVPTGRGPWSGPEPRRAGVSSFGIGGTNVHVVVEQPPARSRPATPPQGPRLVLASAADEAALARTATRLGAHLAAHEPELADVAATLATGRAELPARLAVTGRTAAEVAQRLTRGTGVVRGALPTRGPAPSVFVFPGQGAQYPGMALPLAAALPGFGDALDACLAAFAPELAQRLRRALTDPDFPAAELRRTELAQPALFAVEHAAATALTGLGVHPVALAGHSLGEITAACVAGVFELADAARLVTARGQAMQECPEGAMLALGCTETRARELLAVSGLDLELAAVNSADGCVVAGPAAAVQEFTDRLGGRVFTHRLATGRAFHTALVEPALPRLAEELAGLTVRPPTVPFATNVTGRLVPAGTPLRPELFVEQARRTVRFADALDAVAEAFPGALVVEIGPGRVLSAMAEAAGLDTVPLHPARGEHPQEEVLSALGTLWTRGQPLSPRALCGPAAPRVHLPHYPFAGPRWTAPEAEPRSDAARTTTTRPEAPEAPAPEMPAPEMPAAEPSAPEAPEAPALPPAAPDTAVVLARLWSELLGHDGLAADADFFELGGDSLLVTHLARKLGRELGVRVPIRSLMTGSTLAAQTELVRELTRQDPKEAA
ncbi:beta-ketoacyl synthase N-terminal-like domain-containing protein [Streptomyces sp. LHD-70]|uniref:type I polyketide synthase n=1 Tax=Streptomyces sp. LHD-70 TaxID=3072140 RepID=UPI00280DC216|nr:beta-ketoacyl synthase N-terminal-like domain-containing protein [Streptomyces sp. LHD-70]MDQ8706947.1 beta-ketoacyl synthase N-terminal-like domain-containing protein [Streptomyces sp. LHD-70]